MWSALPMAPIVARQSELTRRTSPEGKVICAHRPSRAVNVALVPALQLPDWVHRLALTAHLGQPMVGTWDAAGVLACLVLAVGGLLLGAEGLARRDLRA